MKILVKKFAIAFFWESMFCVWFLVRHISYCVPGTRWRASLKARTQFLRCAILAGRWDLVWLLLKLRAQLAVVKIKNRIDNGRQRH
jgi:hypothetical protein